MRGGSFYLLICLPSFRLVFLFIKCLFVAISNFDIA